MLLLRSAAVKIVIYSLSNIEQFTAFVMYTYPHKGAVLLKIGSIF
jgi:hypothetical protein